MKLQTISSLKVGDKVESFYIIRSCQCKVTNNNNKYLDMELGDSTGTINAKLWDYKEGYENIYVNNALIKIRGTVTSWNDQLQLKIERIRPTKPSDNVDPAKFVATAPYKAEQMYNQIISFISKISNSDIKKIISYIISENKEKLMIYPAAVKHHHAIRSGLLYHITTMLKVAEKLAEVYPFINRDLLYAGVILHDIAKTSEMDAGELGIASQYTTEGNLLGHIIQGIKMVEQAAKEVGADPECSLLLQHMILTHHYEPEFGSPKKPMFPEAELLHYIDLIDSKMYKMQEILESVPSNSFSERIWALDNRQLYKAGIEHKDDNEKSLA